MTTKPVVTDTLETLLDLVIETVGANNVAIGNGGSTPGDSGNNEWYVLAYWHDNPSNPSLGDWDIHADSATLRGALCQVIAHERFGQ